MDLTGLKVTMRNFNMKSAGCYEAPSSRRMLAAANNATATSTPVSTSNFKGKYIAACIAYSCVIFVVLLLVVLLFLMIRKQKKAIALMKAD